ncbi:MAG TPA: type 4a pilus biogenesis protein PilO [Gaiellaceae bacterium]|nr:type 4a pilus biogenesis protein PilO [Gaiellaceae bacterium]
MRARVADLSPRTRMAVALAVALVYAAAVWFLVVSPKRSEVARLDAEVTAAELRLADARATASRPRKSTAPVTDVVRLAKAMPASSDEAGLVLELAILARRAGVTLGSIAPGAKAVDGSGATLVPVVVSVTGSYGRITTFMKKARELVGVRKGKLQASGRLFSVQGVELSESSAGKFPLLDATITLDAYAYDGPIVPPTPPTPAPAEEGSTSGPTAAGGTP